MRFPLVPTNIKIFQCFASMVSRSSDTWSASRNLSSIFFGAACRKITPAYPEKQYPGYSRSHIPIGLVSLNGQDVRSRRRISCRWPEMRCGYSQQEHRFRLRGCPEDDTISHLWQLEEKKTATNPVNMEGVAVSCLVSTCTIFLFILFFRFCFFYDCSHCRFLYELVIRTKSKRVM